MKKAITLMLTDKQVYRLNLAKNRDTIIKQNSLEAYCIDVLLSHAIAITEPPQYEDIICPHCHQITTFQWLCDKCNKTFTQYTSIPYDPNNHD